MKKILLAFTSIILIIAMLLPMAGCSADDNSDASGSSSESFEQLTQIVTEALESEEEETTEKKTTAKKTTAKKTETTLKPGVTVAKEALKAKTYKLSEKNNSFRFIGRSRVISNGIQFDHSASGIEFHGYMTGDVKLTVDTAADSTYYTIFIDGKRADTRLSTKGNNKTITIANFKGNYYHTIKILKQTEERWSRTVLKELSMTGYLLSAPEQRKYHIEVLGDSLTTGYGNLGKKGEGNAQGGNTPLKQDATKMYGFLAAEALNADCTVVAWSGIGLDKSYTGTSFGNYYKKYAQNRNSDAYTYGRAPDVLVIHLGANDSTNKETTKAGFVKKGKELIEMIRKGYGKNMPIIWAYDPNEGVPDYIKEVLDSFGGEAKGLYMLKLEWQSKNEYWGASGHPSEAAHKKHAELLVNLIKSKNLLK